jgi:hypothetical protein
MMADAAHSAARNASCPEVRDAFIGIAAAWERMIAEMAQEAPRRSKSKAKLA